jgi:hypothetical protein
MKQTTGKILLAAAILLYVVSADTRLFELPDKEIISSAQAIIGRPMTPVSYAGVARRTPVAGVNRVGNRGGPVNRVGRR